MESAVCPGSDGWHLYVVSDTAFYNTHAGAFLLQHFQAASAES